MASTTFNYVACDAHALCRRRRAAKLTIAHADASGHLAIVAQVPTQAGARNGVVAKDGTVYLAHARIKLSALVVVSPNGK